MRKLPLLIITSFIGLTVGSAVATSPTLELITQPLYTVASSNQENGVLYGKVPKLMNHTYPPLMVQWYYSTTKATGLDEDVNLIFLYGVHVSVTKSSEKGGSRTIRVDYSKAKKPKDFPFSVKQVAGFTARAIREDFNDPTKTKILIFDGEKSLEYNEEK